MVLLTNASGAGYSWRVENVNNVGHLFETRHGVATTNEWQMHRGNSCCLYLSLHHTMAGNCHFIHPEQKGLFASCLLVSRISTS